MAALDFPISPANNQIYTLNGVQYYYNGVIGAWLTNLITNPVNANTTNTQILFNDAGYTNGSFGLIYNRFANTFGTNNIIATGNVTVTSNVTAGNVFSTGRIGVGTSTPTFKIDVVNGALGTLANNQVLHQRFFSSAGNADYLEITDTRMIDGASWLGAGSRLQQKVDATWQAWIQFNGGTGSNRNDYGITFGAGGSTANATAVPEVMRITQTGSVGIGNTNPSLKLEVAGNMSVDAFVECSSNITTNYTITTGRNAMTAGPVTINNGVTVTVPDGSTWTIV